MTTFDRVSRRPRGLRPPPASAAEEAAAVRTRRAAVGQILRHDQRDGGSEAPAPGERGEPLAVLATGAVRVQRRTFGTDVRLDALPGTPPRARVLGPYTTEAIAGELYGDRTATVEFDPAEPLVVFVRYGDLREAWREYFSVGAEDELLRDYSEEQIAQAATFALGTTLYQSATSVEVVRTVYNNGTAAIVAERARLILEAVPGEAGQRLVAELGQDLDKSTMVRRLREALPADRAAQIAERVAGMRHRLAVDVRRASGALLERGAELIDAVRRQARPTYDSLRAAGTTDAEIIRSATRTNRFVNHLPRGMRIAGGGLWVVSGGISVYIVLSADAEDRERVAREEAGAFIGGAAGTAAFTGVCVATGIATAGVGLVVCGVLGGLVGGAIGRDPMAFLRLLDIAPRVVPERSGRMYRLEGTIEEVDLFIVSFPTRTVSASEHAVVVGTGTVSGQLVGGRGHYRREEVIPANAAAERILGGTGPTFVPQYVLRDVTPEDIRAD